MVAIRPALSPPGRAMVKRLLVCGSALSPVTSLMALSSARRALRSIGERWLFATAELFNERCRLALSRHRQQTIRVAVREIDTRDERIQCGL